MARDKRIQVVLSDRELLAFQKYAENQGLSMSETLRQYIRAVAPPLSPSLSDNRESNRDSSL